MIDQTQKLFYTVISLMVSAILHFVMWIGAEHFTMRPFDSQRTIAFRKTQLDVIDMKVISRPDEGMPVIDLSDIISQQKNILQNLFDKEGLMELPQPSHLPRTKDSATYRINAVAGGRKTPSVPLSMLPSDLMASKPKNTALERPTVKERSIVPRIQRNHKFNLGPTSVPELRVHSTTIKNKIFDTEIKIPPDESKKAGISTAAHNIPELITMTRTRIPKVKMKPLDSVLAATAKLYQDPTTKETFFQVEITYDDEKPVDSLPKDILFLQDASSSISFSKLQEFKKGVKLGIDYLRQDDGYNIVTFRDKPKPLFPAFVSATLENSKRAKRLIDTISSSGKTDIYSGLAPYASLAAQEPNRPVIILLISDGRTTTGLKLKDRELISRIIRERNDDVSIFSFSAGAKANLFLMDFLSYMNRGISIHVEKKDHASRSLANFIATLSDTIIADLTYRITGNLQAEIYPKELPHLFRRYPLTLHGKLTPGIDEIGIQIIGKNGEGKKEELIKRINLNSASPAGRELAQRWARQKIYHLLGESIVANTTNLESDITNLALQYNIDIPY